MQRGILSQMPDAKCLLMPVADGGDGTLSIISSVINGRLHTLNVPGPLLENIEASWFSTNDTCVIELAQASGIGHLSRLDPMNANTQGTGALIKDAHAKGFKNFILTVGGSASTDGGTGILCALGAKLLDKNDNELKPCGASLVHIDRIDLSNIAKDMFDCKFTIACDVENPLYGPDGAAYIFAPQKGATKEQVSQLDTGLQNLARVMNGDLAHFKGAGAAGGVPYLINCVFGAKIISGFEWIMEIFDLENKIKNTDIVLTGEGSLDEQSIHGKAVGKILELCVKNNKMLWIFPAVKNLGGYDFIKNRAKVFPVQREAGQMVELEDIEQCVANVCKDLRLRAKE